MIPSLSVFELFTLHKTQQSVAVLDIRTPEELLQAHLPFAHHVAQEDLLNFCHDHEKTYPLFAILCHHGVRSAHATMALRQHHINARNISGGIHAWSLHIDPSVPLY